MTSQELYDKIKISFIKNNENVDRQIQTELLNIIRDNTNDAVALRALGLYNYNIKKDSTAKIFLNKAINLRDAKSMYILFTLLFYEYRQTSDIIDTTSDLYKELISFLDKSSYFNDPDALLSKGIIDKNMNLLIKSIIYSNKDDLITFEEKIHKLQDLCTMYPKFKNHVICNLDKFIFKVIVRIDECCKCSVFFLKECLTKYHKNYGLDEFFKKVLETNFFTEAEKRNFQEVLLTKIHQEIENKKEICAVCIEPFIGVNKSTIIFRCGHVFHYECVYTQDVCPCCRLETPFKLTKNKQTNNHDFFNLLSFGLL
jgi:hypothetical protein